MGKAFTRINGKTYQVKFLGDSSLFKDTEIKGRTALVDNKFSTFDLASFSFFNDDTVNRVVYLKKD